VKYIIILSLLFSGCGPQYAKDPNAHVLVTSQYENEPPKIVYPSPNEECRPQLDCSKKSNVECAIALLDASKVCIKEAHELAEKKMYISAKLEFLLALTRLSEAEIRLKNAKTESFDDWKVVTTLGLEEKIKNTIDYCQKMIRVYTWR
tara:strand:- start:74872 stop:75315 length:444 start_codon:yes stop_codon:yes gene_type:complete